MTKKTTRDAALSRLFGAEGQPEEDESVDRGEEEGSSSEPGGSIPIDEQTERTQDPSSLNVSRRGGDLPAKKTANESQAKDHQEQQPKEMRSGYIGLGRYAREDGILERITPYVRPDQAEALRVAVARKRDPRGRDISRIIQTLLDEAGYRESGEEEG